MEATTCPNCKTDERIHYWEAFNGDFVARCGECNWRRVTPRAPLSLMDRLLARFDAWFEKGTI